MCAAPCELRSNASESAGCASWLALSARSAGGAPGSCPVPSWVGILHALVMTVRPRLRRRSSLSSFTWSRYTWAPAKIGGHFPVAFKALSGLAKAFPRGKLGHRMGPLRWRGSWRLNPYSMQTSQLLQQDMKMACGVLRNSSGGSQMGAARRQTWSERMPIFRKLYRPSATNTAMAMKFCAQKARGLVSREPNPKPQNPYYPTFQAPC